MVDSTHVYFQSFIINYNSSLWILLINLTVHFGTHTANTKSENNRQNNLPVVGDVTI
jgi:hypothetical protein